MSIPAALAATVLLLLGNAYFVACEFAVMGARRSRIEPLVDEGRRGAAKVLYALEHLTLMLATCQLGVTVCSVALGAVSEPAIAHLVELPLTYLHAPHELTHPIAFVTALLLVVCLHVVMGEMVPKNLTITTPERAALIFVPLLTLLSKIFYPLVASLNWLTNHFVRLLGVQPKEAVAAAFTADEVASIVEVSEEAGVLHADKELLSGALEFSEHVAGEVMVPLAQLQTVPADITVQDFEERVGQSGFSRFPVTAASVSAASSQLASDAVAPSVTENALASSEATQLVGYLHLKDVLDVPAPLRNLPIPAWKIRPLPTVHESDEVESALRTMQKAGTHMAAVVRDSAAGNAQEGERGIAAERAEARAGAAEGDNADANAKAVDLRGVIFLEDILEELVGEVRDAMQRR